MDDRFFEFSFGQSVGMRPGEVPAELVGAATANETRDGGEAPVPCGQLLPLPDVAEEDTVGEFDKFKGKVTDEFLGADLGRIGT
jgi:hypothetical protein